MLSNRNKKILNSIPESHSRNSFNGIYKIHSAEEIPSHLNNYENSSYYQKKPTLNRFQNCPICKKQEMFINLKKSFLEQNTNLLEKENDIYYKILNAKKFRNLPSNNYTSNIGMNNSNIGLPILEMNPQIPHISPPCGTKILYNQPHPFPVHHSYQPQDQENIPKGENLTKNGRNIRDIDSHLKHLRKNTNRFRQMEDMQKVQVNGLVYLLNNMESKNRNESNEDLEVKEKEKKKKRARNRDYVFNKNMFKNLNRIEQPIRNIGDLDNNNKDYNDHYQYKDDDSMSHLDSRKMMKRKLPKLRLDKISFGENSNLSSFFSKN